MAYTGNNTTLNFENNCSFEKFIKLSGTYLLFRILPPTLHPPTLYPITFPLFFFFSVPPLPPLLPPLPIFLIFLSPLILFHTNILFIVQHILFPLCFVT